MATEQIPLATLITLRDNLVTAYTAISQSPPKSYMMGDRQFTYEDRNKIWEEITSLDRIILLRSNTYKALGKNRMDFAKWN